MFSNVCYYIYNTQIQIEFIPIEISWDKKNKDYIKQSVNQNIQIRMSISWFLIFNFTVTVERERGFFLIGMEKLISRAWLICGEGVGHLTIWWIKHGDWDTTSSLYTFIIPQSYFW